MHALVFSILLLSAFARPLPPSLGRRCDKARLRVNCGSHVGIFWKLGSAPFAGVKSAAGYRPIDVAADTRAIVAVCNLANSRSKRLTDVMLPNLVRNIGPGAVVTVQVINSVNQNVSTSFLLRSSPLRKSSAALLGPIVSGTIGRGAELSVFIRNSANVYLDAGAVLYVRDAALISSPVLAKGCVKHACIDVQLSEAGNVIGGHEILLSGSSLLKSVFDARCTDSVLVFGDVRTAGIVRNVQRLVLGSRAALAKQFVDIHSATKTNVSIGLADTASAVVRKVLDVRGSNLITQVIRVVDARALRSVLRIENVANAVSNMLIAFSREAVHLASACKFDTMQESMAFAFVLRSASAVTKSVRGLRTISNIVEINGVALNSVVNTTLIESGTVTAG